MSEKSDLRYCQICADHNKINYLRLANGMLICSNPECNSHYPYTKMDIPVSEVMSRARNFTDTFHADKIPICGSNDYPQILPSTSNGFNGGYHENMNHFMDTSDIQCLNPTTPITTINLDTIDGIKEEKRSDDDNTNTQPVKDGNTVELTVPIVPTQPQQQSIQNMSISFEPNKVTIIFPTSIALPTASNFIANNHPVPSNSGQRYPTWKKNYRYDYKKSDKRPSLPPTPVLVKSTTDEEPRPISPPYGYRQIGSNSSSTGQFRAGPRGGLIRPKPPPLFDSAGNPIKRKPGRPRREEYGRVTITRPDKDNDDEDSADAEWRPGMKVK